MRLSLLAAALCITVCASAQADVTFTPLASAGVQITKISGNGEFAVGVLSGAAGFRWTAATGTEELLPELDFANGINDAGTIAGAVPENGGTGNGGRDLGAYAAVGAAPVQLTDPLQTNANGYDIADDGTVVGLSFDDGFAGSVSALVWTAAEGMTALPVNRPANYSRANVISADGHVIAGWNDQDDGSRTAVVWQDRIALDLADADGNVVGEADGISSSGEFVVGGSYTDSQGETTSWRWSAKTGVQKVPGMAFAFGVTDDGKTVVGANGFFDTPARAAMIWQEGIGTMTLVDYLAARGVTLPDGWDANLAGGFSAISADGSLMGGWSFGPVGDRQSYLVRVTRDDIFANGFDGASTP